MGESTNKFNSPTMNQSPPNLHFYQKEIIGKLALEPKLPFSGLKIDRLESEHMNYHLKKLIDLGFVLKEEGVYSLTDMGKDYSNLMDDDMKTIEKQPKTSVIINAVREDKESGEVQSLLCRRLREPYFNKVGRLTGKVRFGETLWEAAERELYEETGLKAESYELEEVYHKIRYREDGVVVQDVLFYRFLVKGIEGKMIRRAKYQENFWASKQELEDKEKYDLFSDLEMRDSLEPRELSFVEKRLPVEGY